jgi:hypothetical protein
VAEAHEDPRFYHAVTYTIAITVTVAGGARWDTSWRRADRLAERLASAAARAKDAVEVTAVAGASHDGEILMPRRVSFAGGNTGLGSGRKLSRYLDPDHERALASLAAANARYRAKQQADRDRRTAVGCANVYRGGSLPERPCPCVYCEPEDHELGLRQAERFGSHMFGHRCLCGVGVPEAHGRCLRHRDVEIVLLDGDGAALQLLARADDREEPA